MPMERNRSPQGVTSHQTPFCDSSFQRLFDGHGGLQSAAAKPGLDRNRRIATVRVKRLAASHGPPKRVQKFLVNRVSIALGNIVTFPGRRPSEDPSPALRRGQRLSLPEPFPRSLARWLQTRAALLKIPRPLSCGRGQAARRLLPFCNRRDARVRVLVAAPIEVERQRLRAALVL